MTQKVKAMKETQKDSKDEAEANTVTQKVAARKETQKVSREEAEAKEETQNASKEEAEAKKRTQKVPKEKDVEEGVEVRVEDGDKERNAMAGQQIRRRWGGN